MSLGWQQSSLLWSGPHCRPRFSGPVRTEGLSSLVRSALSASLLWAVLHYRPRFSGPVRTTGLASLVRSAMRATLLWFGPHRGSRFSGSVRTGGHASLVRSAMRARFSGSVRTEGHTSLARSALRTSLLRLGPHWGPRFSGSVRTECHASPARSALPATTKQASVEQAKKQQTVKKTVYICIFLIVSNVDVFATFSASIFWLNHRNKTKRFHASFFKDWISRCYGTIISKVNDHVLTVIDIIYKVSRCSHDTGIVIHIFFPENQRVRTKDSIKSEQGKLISVSDKCW